MQVAQGGTLSLPVQYHDASNALVDPVDPSLTVLDPLNAEVAAGLVPVRDSQGLYHYDWTAAPDAALGEWTARWFGTIDGALVSADDPFGVVTVGYIGPTALVTVGEVKTLLDVDPTDTRKDAQYGALIPGLSRLIATYTERDFGAPNVTEERTFEYDGSGYLDIDDASVVTAVAITVPNFEDLPLSTDEWMAMPPRRDDSPVFYYVVMPGIVGLPSAEMGFTRNLDVVASEGRWRGLPNMVRVTATWGWPEVPEDVKLAVAWTMQDWTDAKSSEGLSSEAIEGWARSWGARGTAAQTLAIPNRARDILFGYMKQRV